MHFRPALRSARRFAALATLLAATTLAAGCAPAYYAASDPYAYPQRVERVEYGVVDRIELEREGAPVGLGAVVGGVAGGVIGHQIGDNGTAQTLGGALLGGLIGHQIEKRNDRDDQPDLDKTRCRYVSTR